MEDFFQGGTIYTTDPNEVRDCPYCGFPCRADFVDVGLGGWAQVGPFHCDECKASQIGPNDKPRELTDREKETGWYAPHSLPGSSANVIGGEIVTAEQMRRVYRKEFEGNPLYHVDAYVAEWWEKIRTEGM